MDIDKLVDQITAEIMRRVNADEGGKVLVKCDCPGVLAEGVQTTASLADACCVLLGAEEYRRLCGGAPAPAEAPAAECCCEGGELVDLQGKRLIHERDLRDHNCKNGTVVKVDKKAIVTALAHDYARGIGAKIVKG